MPCSTWDTCSRVLVDPSRIMIRTAWRRSSRAAPYTAPAVSIASDGVDAAKSLYSFLNCPIDFACLMFNGKVFHHSQARTVKNLPWRSFLANGHATATSDSRSYPSCCMILCDKAIILEMGLEKGLFHSDHGVR
jgi:hypothetical protein